MSTSRGINVKDVASDQFVVAYAAHLKRIGKIEVPKWADLVKTASYKELAPYDPDWYYIRAGTRPLGPGRGAWAVLWGPLLPPRRTGATPTSLYTSHC